MVQARRRLMRKYSSGFGPLCHGETPFGPLSRAIGTVADVLFYTDFADHYKINAIDRVLSRRF